MIAFPNTGDAFSNIYHHASSFMTQNSREKPLGVCSRECEFIGMTNSSGLDFHQNLPRLGAVKVYCLNLKWFACFIGNGCVGLHNFTPMFR